MFDSPGKTIAAVAAVTSTTALLALGGVSWAGSAPTIKGVGVAVYGANAQELKDTARVYVSTTYAKKVSFRIEGYSKVTFLSRKPGDKLWRGESKYPGLSRRATFFITVKSCNSTGCTVRRQRHHA